jgi:hypothetical protein
LCIKRSDEKQAETFFINILSEDIKEKLSHAVSYSYYNFVFIVIISKALVAHYTLYLVKHEHF